MTQNLTKGKPFGVILKFALPIVGGNLFQLFYTLADSIIVGRTLGANALAAIGATTAIIYFILCFIQGITSGFGICLGHRFGANDIDKMKQSIAISTLLCIIFTIVITIFCCIFLNPILVIMKTPQEIYSMAYSYTFIILFGTGATIFYNMISNILRALGDSKTPLIYLVFSSILNIILDIVFILPLNMGISGAALATILSQLISAILCSISGIRKFDVIRISTKDFKDLKHDSFKHLRIGFPMGFQMSVMCIGQLAMQIAVNNLGSSAIAGYTVASKVDQISVLVNTAFSVAISNYVAQNYGAGLIDRIKIGVRQCLLQTTLANIIMCVLILSCKHFVVPIFINNATNDIIKYSDTYLNIFAPFYILLGVLVIYRSAVQSMNNTWAPFTACIIELIMRISATTILASFIGYIGICFATPLAWIGASTLLLIVYYKTNKCL